MKAIKKLWRRIKQALQDFINEPDKGKEPWQIAAARYFVVNSEKGFTKEEYKKHILKKYKVSNTHLEHFFKEEIEIPTGRDYSTTFREGSQGWIPPLDLVSQVTDFDELKEARKNARNAFAFSIIANAIAAVTLIISAAALMVSVIKN